MLKLNYNRRSDRMKLFLILFTLFSIVSFSFSYFYGFFDSPEGSTSGENKPAAIQGNPGKKREETSAVMGKPKPSPVEPNESKDSLTGEEIVQSQHVAAAFMKAYYTYDSKRPEQYIEHAKRYMAEPFYEEEKQYIRRQTKDRESTKVLAATVLPVDHYAAGEVIWSVIITGEARSSNGKVLEETQEYFVTLQHIRDEWKVVAFSLEGGGH